MGVLVSELNGSAVPHQYSQPGPTDEPNFIKPTLSSIRSQSPLAFLLRSLCGAVKNLGGIV